VASIIFNDPIYCANKHGINTFKRGYPDSSFTSRFIIKKLSLHFLGTHPSSSV
jgi:hypothetical protein